jgi:hypothetical protein
MRGFKRIAVLVRELIAWGAAGWHILGWLGLSSLVAGLAISIGGAVWAVISGTSIPIAIMAGFCTLVGAIYLTIAPAAFRALTIPKVPNSRESEAPNYEAWRQVKVLTLLEASKLWAGVDPGSSTGTYDSHAWYRVLSDAIFSGDLKYIPKSTGNVTERYAPSPDTKIAREALGQCAAKCGQIPKFLSKG